MSKLSFLVLFGLSLSVQAQKSSTRQSGNDTTIILTLGTPQIKPLPVIYKAEYEAGNVRPGDHTQHMLDLSYSESDPDRIYMAQDVSNIWVSRDDGLNWFTLSNKGLNSNFVIAVEADPLNKNRVLAAVQCRPYDGANDGEQGIYQSLDGGVTWQKKAGRKALGEVRSSTKLIAYAPTSKNTTLGYAKRWYAAFSEYKNTLKGNELVADDGLLYSDDGGSTWTEIRKLPAREYGKRVRGIKVHTTNQDKVFMYGEGGLFRFEDAVNPAGVVTKLSGSNGLPEGDVWGKLYQSSDGNVLIVAVSKKGIYKSLNGGASWSLLYEWADINYCYVSEAFPDKIFAVPAQKSQKQIRISDDGGKTWNSPALQDVVYRLGYDNSNWNKLLNGQFTCVIPDPRNVNNVFIHTTSKNFRSVDGGKTWSVSDYGYNGSSHSAPIQMFDPVNPDRFCYFMTDRGVVVTTTKGLWFKDAKIIPAEFGLGWKSSIAGALHPSKPVILAYVGTGAVGKLLRSPDNGDTWQLVSDGNKARWVIAFDLKNPRYCYQWRERSEDDGVTWKELTTMPANAIICGVSPSNGSVLYAMDVQGSGTRKKVWRSVNRGDSWELVIESSWDLTYPGPNNQFIFRVDPADENIVYTSSSTGTLTRWNLKTLPARQTDIAIGGITKPDFSIQFFAIDPRHSGVMYAINQRANTGNKFFRTIDGGKNWQNISEYIPQGSSKGLAVSPVTGEVYISSESGSLVMLPPYKTSNTAYDWIPYKMNHINAPYN